MLIKFLYIFVVGLVVGIGVWMFSGQVVVGGVGDGENVVLFLVDCVVERFDGLFWVKVMILQVQEW